jgi:hypothetical protein
MPSRSSSKKLARCPKGRHRSPVTHRCRDVEIKKTKNSAKQRVTKSSKKSVKKPNTKKQVTKKSSAHKNPSTKKSKKNSTSRLTHYETFQLEGGGYVPFMDAFVMYVFKGHTEKGGISHKYWGFRKLALGPIETVYGKVMSDPAKLMPTYSSRPGTTSQFGTLLREFGTLLREKLNAGYREVYGTN